MWNNSYRLQICPVLFENVGKVLGKNPRVSIISGVAARKKLKKVHFVVNPVQQRYIYASLNILLLFK